MTSSMSDAAFDAMVPRELRHLSAVHWTPVPVAVRAVRWLAPRPGMRVLDVGCGIGKLCAIGAIWTDAEWYGVEHQKPLVEAAIEMARELELSTRTCFVHDDALALDWSPFDALYFYNPFEAQVTGADVTIAEMQGRLASLRPGTRVVTYHGLGGPMPAAYQRVAHEEIELGPLELWIRDDQGVRTS
jgi:predicted RNA methylase